MSWELNPVVGVWFVAALAATLVALTLVGLTKSVSPGRLLALRGLRLAALVLLLVALLRPTLVVSRTESLRGTLVLLVDASRSMTVKDSLAGDSRWDAAARLLRSAEPSLAKLAEVVDVRAYRFDSTPTALGFDAGRLALPAAPTGEGSAIGRSLSFVLENEGAQRLLGVVLLSDGAQRALPPNDLAPQAAARRLALEGAPLFAFAFGQPAATSRADLAVEDLSAADAAFAQTPTDVGGNVRVTGYANQTLRVQLMWEDPRGEMRVVASQAIRTGPVGGVYPFTLRHAPDRPGEQKLTVRVAPLEGEALTNNNHQSTFMRVREGGVKVLYLAGASRIGGAAGGVEQRFARHALAASPDLAVTFRLVNYAARSQPLGAVLGEELYDVYILDDVDALAFDPPGWSKLADRVREGAGLAMLGGRHSFGGGGHAGTELADILPVTPSPLDRQRFGEALRRDTHLEGPLRVRPTDLGAGHPVTLVADTPNAWDELPPLDGANKLTPDALKPNALVLATTTGAPAWPVIVAGQPGSGRTLAVAFDSTWRWALAGKRDAHRRFWRQLALWLARKEEQRAGAVWVEVGARRVTRGAPVEVRAGLSLPGQPAATLRLQVTKPDGAVVDVAPPTGGAAELTEAFTATDLEGDYTVTAEATRAGAALGSASARFLVPQRDLELDQPAADPALLAQLAQLTAGAGGKALAPEELPALLADLAARDPEVRHEVVARVTHWDTWPFFLTLVGLLGVEWWLRKRWGLV